MHACVRACVCLWKGDGEARRIKCVLRHGYNPVHYAWMPHELSSISSIINLQYGTHVLEVSYFVLWSIADLFIVFKSNFISMFYILEAVLLGSVFDHYNSNYLWLWIGVYGCI